MSFELKAEIEKKISLAKEKVSAEELRVKGIQAKMDTLSSQSDAAATNKVAGLRVSLSKAQADLNAANAELAKEETELQKIEVIPVNHPPKASSDKISTKEDEVITGKVSFSDEDNDPITVKLVSKPAHGTVQLNKDGTYSYKPNANYHGEDKFSFVANDGKLDSNTEWVNINVESVEDAPIANPDYAKVNKNQKVEIDVLANDISEETLIAKIESQPKHGKAIINKDGKVEYIPENGYLGTDLFTYKAYNKDGKLSSESTQVDLNVIQSWGEWGWENGAYWGPFIEEGLSQAAQIGRIFSVINSIEGWYFAKQAQKQALADIDAARPKAVEVTEEIKTTGVAGKGVVKATAAAINNKVDSDTLASVHDTQAGKVYGENADVLKGTVLNPQNLPKPEIDITTSTTTTYTATVDGEVVSQTTGSKINSDLIKAQVTAAANKVIGKGALKTASASSPFEIAQSKLADQNEALSQARGDLMKNAGLLSAVVVANSETTADYWNSFTDNLGVMKQAFDLIMFHAIKNAINIYSVYNTGSYINSGFKSGELTPVKLLIEGTLSAVLYYGGDYALELISPDPYN